MVAQRGGVGGDSSVDLKCMQELEDLMSNLLASGRCGMEAGTQI